MNKKTTFIYVGIFFIIVMITIFLYSKTKINNEELQTLTGIVISSYENKLVIQDNKNTIYTFNLDNNTINDNTNIEITCKGNINKEKSIQDCKIINLKIIENNTNNIKEEMFDNGIFKAYYEEAFKYLETLTLDEKIKQLILAHYNENNISYEYGGYLFFHKDFKNKTKDEVKSMINNIQSNAKTPFLTAVDEEGGNVVRISNNKLLREEKFKSPQELYKLDGFNAIRNDVLEKSKFLTELGLNLNLAPVVDISTNPNDYIYARTLGENATLTSIYAKTVIETSHETNVSYTLKHFPGYGNNLDTHTGTSIDTRTYEDIINNDIIPFKMGIEANAEAVMVSHNIVTSIDPENPASLSTSIHNLLRNDLNFTGIIITDDIDMGAVKNIENKFVKALLAGNDIIITEEPEICFNEIKKAISNNTISEEYLNKIVFRIISWKYYKGLIK